ncbi:ammonium transporter Rh type B [Pantherophis guttatus]|uniref:Ammonium transporter Rh type B n=1 Tax=Pantherophis guttatus TaxID=94885 RepID=A0A6P9CU25_PANGU|nr:ammonium transporter Rh type B [Pantherophis guttatus]
MSGHSTNLRLKLPLLCALLQLATVLLFAFFIQYDSHTSPRLWHEEMQLHNKGLLDNEFYPRYPSFQDVHVMVFLGFGFLMTFLKRYSFGGVAFNFLIAAFALQWSILIQGFFHAFHNGKIHVGIESMINADFCAGSILISFGALLGKTSPVQLLLMAGLEVTLFGINEYVLLSLLQVKDAGGSMTIHTFGAYFGLMVSRVLFRPHLDKSRQREGSAYHSDLFAMIGTLFLWVFWPSFNSAVTAHGDDQQRTVMNTYFSLASSTLTAFAISTLVNRGGRLDMVHIQNATLAGGVIVGTSAEMALTPFGALIAGCVAGLVATLGFKFLTPILTARLKIQDTCGIHNLHGLPGLLGALLGALVAALATPDAYGEGMADVFPLVASGQRTPIRQSLFQLLGLLVSLGMAMVGGSLVGAILKMRSLAMPPDALCFEDQIYWEVPEEHHDGFQVVEALSTEEADKTTHA